MRRREFYGEMNYHFFDYKKNIIGYSGEDLFSIKHILIMTIMFCVMIALCIIFKKAKEKNITVFLKVLSIFIPLLEISKITWETVWDLKTGSNFDYVGLLPLYTCSIFMFSLPFAAFGKGRAKKYALSFITTLGVPSGLTNFVYYHILETYPIFTFPATHSMIFHFSMVFTGVFLMVTGYYRPTFIDLLYGMIPLWIFSVLVIPVNFIIYRYNIWVDYMLYMRGAGMPLIGWLSDYFRSHGILLIYSLLMATVGYGTLNLITVSFEQLIFKLTNKKNYKFSKKE